MATSKAGQDQKNDTPERGSSAQTQESSASAEKLRGSERSGPQQEQSVPVEKGGQSEAVQARPQRALSRYGNGPFAMMQRLSAEMDEFFDAFFYGRPTGRSAWQPQLPSLWAPDVEIAEEGGSLRVCVDLPGISRENVKVDVHEGTLTIQGERREERTEGNEQQGFRRSERRYGSFYRAIALPEGADTGQAQATMKDGVLEVTVPMAKPTQARRLEIRS